MKHVIWMAALAVAVGANASEENPFALKKNFQQIEQSQSALLGELKVIAEKQAAIEEAKEDAELDADLAEDDEGDAEAGEEVPSPKAKVAEKEVVTTPKPVDKAREEVPVERVPLEKLKAEQKKVDTVRQTEEAAAAQKRAAEEAARKKAADDAKAKAEAAQKEAARKKAAEEKAKAEKVALGKLKAERAAAEKRAKEAELAKAPKANTAVKKPQPKVSSGGVNIDIAKEKAEAAKRAEEELKKAIAEVDQD